MKPGQVNKSGWHHDDIIKSFLCLMLLFFQIYSFGTFAQCKQKQRFWPMDNTFSWKKTSPIWSLQALNPHNRPAVTGTKSHFERLRWVARCGWSTLCRAFGTFAGEQPLGVGPNLMGRLGGWCGVNFTVSVFFFWGGWWGKDFLKRRCFGRWVKASFIAQFYITLQVLMTRRPVMELSQVPWNPVKGHTHTQNPRTFKKAWLEIFTSYHPSMFEQKLTESFSSRKFWWRSGPQIPGRSFVETTIVYLNCNLPR